MHIEKEKGGVREMKESEKAILKDLEERVKKLENKVYEIKEENKNWKYGDK